MKYYLGIDIGVNGGVAVLDETGLLVELFKTPETRKEFQEKLGAYTDLHSMCILEKVHSQPQNGGKANFTFGQTVERVFYTLELCKIPHQEVTPQTWLKTYMLKKDKEESSTAWKNRLKNRAQQLFPNAKVTLWNADALLIAEFARRYYK